MILWSRALSPSSCGSCAKAIKRNDVILEVRIGSARRKRCEACGVALFRTAYGYGPVPPTLAELPPAPEKPSRKERAAKASPFVQPVVSRGPRQPDFVSVWHLAKSRAVDVRQRQTGERE